MTRRKVYGIDELSPTELAWLTGDESECKEGWPEFWLWNLKNGFGSWHKDRPIGAPELLEQYGHIVSSERRKYLRIPLKAQDRRPVIRNGKLENLSGRHEYSRDGTISDKPFETAGIVPVR